ncbi:dioxygenase family protein [Natronoglycomyces albus]|uniref:Dioxygenase n=1 Tax=Natronoglycomyces albus TaxID=2811108 RepID=A0A895XTQ8_9ACTN|nr:class III extradiol ring-cleavage dioxygenase [Natronoglycomyces albus]QSB05906.1 dioxygenase [Natronoglycomyces albus]
MLTTAQPIKAYADFLPAARTASASTEEWTETDPALPSVYLSHGAPPLLTEADWIAQLFALAQSMPKPRGIVIISAHWEAAPVALTASGGDLVYDFSGFHPVYRELTYATPDSTRLAQRVAAAMPDGEPVHQHVSRGLDHGAWVPLMAMYPNADVPVVQMSIPTHDPHQLLDLGRRLGHLRDEGVLVIGSGFMTHGLPFLDRDAIAGIQVPSWSREFDAWAAEALSTGDIEALANYRAIAPGVSYAHPTVDHFVPLFVTFGAATKIEQPAQTAIDGFWMGLSKRTFVLK